MLGNKVLPKPIQNTNGTDGPGCVGCPMWGDGLGWVPDRIPNGCEVLIVGQNPGKMEEAGQRIVGYAGPKQPILEPCDPQPFVGETGYVQERTFFPLAGLDRATTGLANVLRCRVIVDGGRTNTMPSGAEYRQAVEHCTRAHLRIPEAVKLVVAEGEHAWTLLGGPKPPPRKSAEKERAVSPWRGHLMPEQYGSALVHGDKPRPWPVLYTVHLAYLNRAAWLDLVTRRDWTKIPRILRGEWPKPLPPVVVASYDAMSEVDNWCERGKSAPYIVLDTEYDPDTGALVLVGLGYPEMPFVLQFGWVDAPLAIQSTMRGLLTELVKSAPFVFQNALADVPILRQNMGLDWSSFVRIEDTLQAHAVLWCELPHDLEFQASIDGQYPKLKHLQHTNLSLYNAGDVLETMSAWEARLDEFSRDPDSRKVYDTQMRLLPHIDRSMQVGIAVDQEKVPQAIAKYRERADQGEAMAHAYCGWPINLRSDDQLKWWLYEIEGMAVQKHPESKKPTVHADAVAALRTKYLPFDPQEDEDADGGYISLRIEQGAHPLLEAKILHAHSDHILGHYLYPLVGTNA